MKDTQLFELLFTGIWCLVGAIFAAVGFALRRAWSRREERLRARAAGTVSEVVRRESSGSNGGVNWYPIVEFTADGRIISLESGQGGGRKTHCAGQSVEVLYDPDDPSCFRLAGDTVTRTVGTVFLAVGLGCIAIGLAIGLIVSRFQTVLP